VSRHGTILFYGDSHGRFGPLLGAYAERRPDAVVVLGGMMLDAPPREALAPVFGIASHSVGGDWDSHRCRCQR
jgi:hypothetical protein